MIRWLIYLPISLIMTVVCYLTNFIVLLFCDRDGELHGFWHLWQTWDNSCNPSDIKDIAPKWLLYDWDKHYIEYTKYLSDVNRTRWVTECVNNDWTIIPGVTPDTAYIYVANATSEAVISVCQTGLNNCNGDFTQVRYNYAAIVPSLIEKPSECIASNMPDDIIFSVSPSYPGQRYHWTCNNTILDYNGTTDSSSVRVRTNGLPESYIILEVNAFNDSCGASVSIKDSVMIPRNQYSMSYAEFKEGTEEDYGEFTINGRNLSQTTADFEWYFLDNGIPVADVLSEDGDKYAYYADIQSLYDYGDISLSNRYTVVCVVTMKLSGCKYRKTYGAALPSNYVIPQSSNINSPQRHTIHKNLLTSYVAFPNPSNGILNLKSSNGTNFSYYIYSFSGNLVMSQQNAYSSEYSIDISSLTKGVYEIVYVQHNRRHSGTFIKE